MQDDKEGRHLRNTHEWVNRDTGPAMHSWPLHDYEYDLPSLKPLMKARDFLAAHTGDLPPDMEEILRRQAVDSVLLVPLLRGGQWIGLTGFASCGKKRQWNGEEILLLRHLAHAAVFALDRGECRALRDRLDRVRVALAENEHEPPAGRDTPRPGGECPRGRREARDPARGGAAHDNGNPARLPGQQATRRQTAWIDLGRAGQALQKTGHRYFQKLAEKTGHPNHSAALDTAPRGDRQPGAANRNFRLFDHAFGKFPSRQGDLFLSGRGKSFENFRRRRTSVV